MNSWINRRQCERNYIRHHIVLACKLRDGISRANHYQKRSLPFIHVWPKSCGIIKWSPLLSHNKAISLWGKIIQWMRGIARSGGRSLAPDWANGKKFLCGHLIWKIVHFTATNILPASAANMQGLFFGCHFAFKYWDRAIEGILFSDRLSNIHLSKR